MAEDDGSDDLKIAELLPRLAPISWMLIGVIACGWLLWQVPPSWRDGRIQAFAAYGIVAAVVSIWGCSRSWRIQLRTDSHGIIVRNLLRSHDISWSEVRRFTDGSVTVFDDHYWALEIVLRDGRAVTATASTGTPGKAYPGMLRAIEEMARHYAIPVAFTGIAKRRGWPDAGVYPDPGGKPGWLRHWDGKKWSLFIIPESTGRRSGKGLARVWSLFPEAEKRWQAAVSWAARLRQALIRRHGSTSREADKVSPGEPENGELSGEVWSPLPWEEDRWKEAASRARRAGIMLTLWLIAAAAALAGAAYLFLEGGSNNKDSSSLDAAALAAGLLIFTVPGPWKNLNRSKKIDQIGRSASRLGGTGNDSVSPNGE